MLWWLLFDVAVCEFKIIVWVICFSTIYFDVRYVIMLCQFSGCGITDTLYPLEECDYIAYVEVASILFSEFR